MVLRTVQHAEVVVGTGWFVGSTDKSMKVEASAKGPSSAKMLDCSVGTYCWKGSQCSLVKKMIMFGFFCRLRREYSN